jgi:hypothetical protein
MITLSYPSKNFLSTALKSLRDGEDLTINVSSGWRRRWIERMFKTIPLSHFEAYNAQSSGKKPPSFFVSIALMPIVTVHNFALSGDYKVSLESSDDLRLIYSYPVR